MVWIRSFNSPMSQIGGVSIFIRTTWISQETNSIDQPVSSYTLPNDYWNCRELYIPAKWEIMEPPCMGGTQWMQIFICSNERWTSKLEPRIMGQIQYLEHDIKGCFWSWNDQSCAHWKSIQWHNSLCIKMCANQTTYIPNGHVSQNYRIVKYLD